MSLAAIPNSQRTPLERLVYAKSLVTYADQLFADGHRVKEPLADCLRILQAEINKIQTPVPAVKHKQVKK